MNSSLTELSCIQFTEALAAKVSIPGSGGAAAMTAALAASLAAMVANFTSGRKKYASYEADILRILQDAESIRHRLLELVQEDADVFGPLSHAYALPKDDPRRSDVVERETLNACLPSCEIMEQVAACIELLAELRIKGTHELLSDVGTSALLCRAALEAASYNVYANTQLMNDTERAAQLEARCDELLVSFVPRAEAIASEVMDSIRDRYRTL